MSVLFESVMKVIVACAWVAVFRESIENVHLAGFKRDEIPLAALKRGQIIELCYSGHEYLFQMTLGLFRGFGLQ